MICPVCEQEGKKSTVQVGTSTRPAVMETNYYDEEGHPHCHSREWLLTWYSCSNGHAFRKRFRKPCPAYPEHCDYAGAEELLEKGAYGAAVLT